MKKIAAILVFVIVLFLSGCSGKVTDLRLAVEYTTHAASAYVAQEKGWLPLQKDSGLFNVYVTGTALSAAITKGDVDAAYICLIPALTAYANGNVPIKIVCGTHKYGYGLLVDPAKLKNVEDLEKAGLKIGCVREGGTTDILLHRIIEQYKLDEEKILSNIMRLDPPKQLLALKAGKIDVALVPEHFATLAEEWGFTMLIKSQDVWPGMPGSVLAVTERILKENKDVVKELYDATSRATDYIKDHPAEASAIVAGKLNDLQEAAGLSEATGVDGDFNVAGNTLKRSMANLEYTTHLNKELVQEIIDLMVDLGYIKKRFSADEIFLKEDWYE